MVLENKTNQAHEFALYYQELSRSIPQIQQETKIEITDRDFVHRVGRILRLNSDESVIIFDRNWHMRGTILIVDKHKLVIKAVKIQNNALFEHSITCFLPLLKREALEESVYGLAALGIQEIHLVNTQKVQRSWSSKELERLQRVVIAAAEQSKYFSFPSVHEPVLLSELLKKDWSRNQLLFFDPLGEPLFSVITTGNKAQKEMVFMIGPEGDLTTQEKKLLREQGFIFCALTQTILRAEQAVCLAGGILRMILQ